MQIRAASDSATGAPLSQYTTFYTGPKRAGDRDGPEEMHIVLVDNGRSRMIADEFREMLRCIRCGACMNHCVVYRQIGGHAYGGTYPGPMAAVPMAAVAAILLCGTEPKLGTVSRLLSWRPLVALGDRSYAVYLVHWPLLVLVTYLLSGGESNRDGKGILAAAGTTRGVVAGIGVIVVSLVLAWLTLRFIETLTRQKAKPAERS